MNNLLFCKPDQMVMNTSSIFSHSFFNSIVKSVPYGIIAINHEGEISLINDLAIEFFDINQRADLLYGKKLTEIIKNIPDFEKVRSNINNGLMEDFDHLEIAFIDKYLTVRGRKLDEGMIITVQDISNIKEIESNAINSVILGQEMERKRMSKEIHDGIGPTLSIIRIMLDSFKERLNPEQANDLDKIITQISEISEDIRRISHDLTPRVLEDFGLEDAFLDIANKINGSKKIKVDFYSTLGKVRLNKELELGLYRIGQELINNAIKHSETSTINIQLIKHTDTIMLMIEDFGKGIKYNLSDSSGIGLKNINTRVKALEGVFNIETIQNKGAILTVELPL